MRAVPLALLLIVLLPVGDAAAELFAGQISAANAHRRRVGGPDAIAGLGDWALSNGTLCAALADPDHETVLSQRGGILVDLGHCGRGDDQFVQLQSLFNFSRSNIPPTSELFTEVEDGEARVVTAGEMAGVRFRTVYALDEDEPERMRVTSRVERTEPGDAFFLFGDVVLHGTASLQAFTANTTDPSLNIGWSHPPVDPDRVFTMMRAIQTTDLQVLVAGGAPRPGISYGLRLGPSYRVRRDGTRESLPSMGLNGDDFTILGVFSNALRFGGGRIGLIELAQLPFMDLQVGETLVYERHLVVGGRSDVSSVTDRIWRDAPRLTGWVDDPGVRIAAIRADRAPMTDVRPDEDGNFALRLPPGEYVLRATSPDAREVERRIEVVEGRDTELAPLVMGVPARVALPPIAPARLVFLGVDGTPDPRFGSDGIVLRFGDREFLDSGETNQIFLGGVADDPMDVLLAPGRYRVLATRGPEFTVTEASLVVPGAGERVHLEIDPPMRVPDTRGRLSADFHVHAEPSDDSTLPMRLRLAGFAAEGADVLVATDHDRVSDYGPLVREMGLAGRMAAVIGSEITTTVHGGATPWTSGHYNAWPLRRMPLRYRDGTPRHEGRRLREVVAELGKAQPAALVQLNHPRSRERSDLSFFTHLSVGSTLDPRRPLTRAPNRPLVQPDPESGVRDIDFHAMELLNGNDMEEYRLVRADWLSFLLQGEFRAATANSDTHTSRRTVALPRNLVRMPGARAGSLDEAAFARAVRSGHLCGTTGPILDVTMGGAAPGETARVREAELRVTVEAAPWVPVERVSVYVDGDRVANVPITAGETLSVPLRFERDGFVFVETWAEPREPYSAVAPGFTPFAFCNPIFVDADGDGLWSAPGLPTILPAAISAPGSI